MTFRSGAHIIPTGKREATEGLYSKDLKKLNFLATELREGASLFWIQIVGVYNSCLWQLIINIDKEQFVRLCLVSFFG